MGMSGSNLAQNSKRKISCWICASPLDLGNKSSPRAINSASRASKRQGQLWGTQKGTPTCKSKDQVELALKNSKPQLSP